MSKTYMLPDPPIQAFVGERSFGVELETSGNLPAALVAKYVKAADPGHKVRAGRWVTSIDNAEWHIKPDSTCGPAAHRSLLGRDYGLEIASFKARGLEDIDTIASVTAELSRAGVKVNQNCGLHVHVEMLEAGESHAGVLLSRWLRAEPILAMAVARKRAMNTHCRLLRDQHPVPAAIGSAEAMYQRFRPTNLRVHGNDSKRAAMNLVPFARALRDELNGEEPQRKTVEFRLPAGTVNARDVRYWAMLFIHFTEVAMVSNYQGSLLPATTVDGAMSELGLGCRENPIQLDKHLWGLKRWLLRKIVKHSPSWGAEDIRRECLSHLHDFARPRRSQ